MTHMINTQPMRYTHPDVTDDSDAKRQRRWKPLEGWAMAVVRTTSCF